MANLYEQGTHVDFLPIKKNWGGGVCAGCLLLRAGVLDLLQAGSALCCGAQAFHCSDFSCGAQALECGPSSCGSSGALEHRLSSCGAGACSAACGIFPDQGVNPCPLHW